MINLQRTQLLISIVEQAPVPVDWPKEIGYPPPGLTRISGYPSSSKGKYDASYPCTKEGKKLAKARAWMFPGRRVRVCGKVTKV